jgi:hypothetical protein
MFHPRVRLQYDRRRTTGPGFYVLRGPLVFVLPVDSEKQYTGEGSPGDDNIDESWHFLPAENAVWNIALLIDESNPEASFHYLKLDVPEECRSWECPPVGLKASAQVLPEWTLDRISGKPATPALPSPPYKTGEKREVTLVPFGFSQLRLALLPIIGVEAEKSIEHGKHKDDV